VLNASCRLKRGLTREKYWPNACKWLKRDDGAVTFPAAVMEISWQEETL
jgi:hypothetical protein